MSISAKVTSVLKAKGMNQNSLAEAYGVSKQSMSNKIRMERWDASDLIKVANMVGGKLAFVLSDGSVITFDPEDEKPVKEKAQG